MRTVGALLFFGGIFVLALAYTMALQGVYVDCFGGGVEGTACALRFYGEPTVSSALYGTVLAVAALITCRIGAQTLPWRLETAMPEIRI